jgi:hypothetical protein
MVTRISAWVPARGPVNRTILRSYQLRAQSRMSNASPLLGAAAPRCSLSSKGDEGARLSLAAGAELHQLSLADGWADTTTAHGRLLVTMPAGIAEFERELIRARIGEGRKRAKAPGVRFGRPPDLDTLPAGRSASATCCGQDIDGCRAILWRQPCDYLTAAPFPGRRVGGLAP